MGKLESIYGELSYINSDWGLKPWSSEHKALTPNTTPSCFDGITVQNIVVILKLEIHPEEMASGNNDMTIFKGDNASLIGILLP